MSEWSVALVVIALVGFAITVGKPIVNLNTTITRLSTVVEGMQKEVTALVAKNSQSHERLWEKNEEQDQKLDNHELRITKFESERGKQ